MYWLLEQAIADRIEDAIQGATAEQMAAAVAFEKETPAPAMAEPDADGVATIQIKGVLTERPSFFAQLFGGGNTTYKSIIDGIAAAEASPSVKSIVLEVDSPGGSAAGAFKAAEAIREAKKPTKARSVGTVASGAYLLASGADSVEATHWSDRYGSVGVVVSMYTSDNEHEITSTNAPKKRSDPRTEEGLAAIREGLDEIEAKFYDAIAEGRGKTHKEIRENFGQGGTMYASAAEKAGMLDKVLTTTARKGTTKRTASMNIDELKAQHPDVYAAVYEKGRDEGVAGERDRANAHITLGTAAGALEIAAKAITEGTGMTETLKAEYEAARYNKQDLDAAAQEGDEVPTASGAQVQDDNTADLAKAIDSVFAMAIDPLADIVGGG